MSAFLNRVSKPAFACRWSSLFLLPPYGESQTTAALAEGLYRSGTSGLSNASAPNGEIVERASRKMVSGTGPCLPKPTELATLTARLFSGLAEPAIPKRGLDKFSSSFFSNVSVMEFASGCRDLSSSMTSRSWAQGGRDHAVQHTNCLEGWG